MRRRPAANRSATARAIPGVVSRGKDLIQTLTISPKQSVGAVVLNKVLSPSSLDPSRLNSEARLWSRWKPVGLRVTVLGAGASTTFGSICIGWDPDGRWQPTKSAGDYTRVAALTPSLTMRLHETRSFVIPCETSRKWYYTLGALEDSSHGSLIGVVASTTGGYAGSLGVNVLLDWVVSFEGVDTPSAGGAVDNDTVLPDSGWVNLFTTSDGDWDAGRLTLKMHSGGAMCPFSAARADHYYEPASNTKVPYVKEDGKVGMVAAFAVIQGFSTPGFACFASVDDAKTYIKTGDVTKVLPYKAAGDYATPDRPVFIGKPAAPGEAGLSLQALQAQVLSLKQQVHDLSLQVQVGNELSLE